MSSLSPRPLQQLILVGLALVSSLQGPLCPLAGHIQEPEVNKITKYLTDNLETIDLLSESKYSWMFSRFLDYFPLKICLHEVCISFYLKEKFGS